MRPVILLATLLCSAVSAVDLSFGAFGSGLKSPRFMALSPDGLWLYVAEAGHGGSSACFDGSGHHCYGATGGVSRFRLSDGLKETVVDGLYSGAANGDTANPTNAIGPVQVFFNNYGELLIGVGYNLPISKASWLALGATNANQASTILKFTSAGLQTLADVQVLEFANNYDGAALGSNIYSAVISPLDWTKIIISDAAANALFTGSIFGGAATHVLDLPNIQRPCMAPGVFTCPAVSPGFFLTAPYCCGYYPDSSTYSAEPVPTQLITRPNYPGELYLAQLTGSFWNSDQASIRKLDAATLAVVDANWVTGFNAITSIAFDGPSTLYVLELKIGNFGTFAGTNRLTRVDVATKTKTVLSTNLVSAFGLFINNGWLYASNGTATNPNHQGAGSVVKVNLHATAAGCPCKVATPCVHLTAGTCHATTAGTQTCPQGTTDKCGLLPAQSCPCSGATPCRYLDTNYCSAKINGACWPPSKLC